MADSTTTAQPGQGNDPASATPRVTEAPAPEGTGTGDGKRKFSDDEAAQLLKENMEFKKRLKALEKKQTDDDEAKLKEQGKFKELAESATTKAKAAEKVAILAKLEAIAVREGLTDLDLLALVDTSGVSFDDAGKVIGANEAVAAFKAAKPAFFSGSAPVPGTAKPGASASGQVKSWSEYIAMPEADRIAWATKHPEAFRAIAANATRK